MGQGGWVKWDTKGGIRRCMSYMLRQLVCLSKRLVGPRMTLST